MIRRWGVDQWAMPTRLILPAPAAPAEISAEAIKPAPPAPIAIAARAFGDEFPPVHDQTRVRLAGLLLLATVLCYLPWMLTSLNEKIAWVAWPFAAANLFSMGYAGLAVCNAWSRRVPARRPVQPGMAPHVGVIIPICGKAVPMILRTIVSVLEQGWPADRLTLVVSDAGHDAELAAPVAVLPVLYYSPPSRDAPERDGAAKAANLNSALAMLDLLHQAGPAYIKDPAARYPSRAPRPKRRAGRRLPGNSACPIPNHQTKRHIS